MGPPTGPQEMLTRHYKIERGCKADHEIRCDGEGRVGRAYFGSMRDVGSWLLILAGYRLPSIDRVLTSELRDLDAL